jgi:sugar (pentulose or hexulose) kinase
MATRDLVVGLDSSTSATKAVAWTREGEAVAEGRAMIPLASPAPDWYEQDPGDWWDSACRALRQFGVAPDRIAAIAVSNQRETFVPLAADGVPVRPAIVWLDQRSTEEVAWLSEKVGPQRIHEISGKPVDLAPVAYRIAWMLRHEPREHGRTAMFADVHAYLTWRLTGQFRTSWASADPLGLFDLEKKEWSPEILAALRVEPGKLPEPFAPGSVLGYVTPEAAAATSLAEGTPVVAGGGDGQAAGLGVNALGSGRAYLNLGTAVVAGIHSRDYRPGLAWRTMGSCSGEGYVLETSLRSGTFLVDWFVENCSGASREEIEREAAEVPAGAGGLLALPYWGAVMTPYWDQDARGCFVGFSGAHRRAHLYRAVLEGIALEQALVTRLIEEDAGIRVREFVAIGGGAASDLWRQIMADACGIPVERFADRGGFQFGRGNVRRGGSRLVPRCRRRGGGHAREYRPRQRTIGKPRDLCRVATDIPGNLSATARNLPKAQQVPATSEGGRSSWRLNVYHHGYSFCL